MQISLLAAPALLILALCAGAHAQAVPPPAPPAPGPLDRKACAEHNMPGEGDTPQTEGRRPPDPDLSDRLAQSGGVICPPPSLDSDIRAPAPGSGTTPVIPPPPPGGGPADRQPTPP